MSIIQAREITRSFEGMEVLSGLDITVFKGEFLAIVGRSGVGKSTLLSILGTHDRGFGGNLLVAGHDTCEMKSSELAALRREHLGFVFQDFHLLPSLSAMENVILPVVFSGGNLELARSQAEDVLKMLSVRTDQTKTSLLSRGERQRVAVARALVSKPRLVLADEPTANLDSKTAFMVIDIMRQMRDDYGVTFIFSTHDPKIVSEVETLFTLEDGFLVNTSKGKGGRNV